MAKIKLSGLISDVAGKLNGSVFQRSKSGLSLRTNPKKKVELSARQRSTFSIANNAARNFNAHDAEKAEYLRTESMRYPMHNNFYTSYYLPPDLHLRKRAVASLAFSGSAILPTPPDLILAPVIPGAPFSYNLNARQLTINYTLPDSHIDNVLIVVDLQFVLNSSTKVKKDKWRHLGYYTPTPPSQSLLIQSYFAPDYILENRRMYVRIRALVAEYGLWSAPITEEAYKV